ncbi:MAG: hypothetical protein P8J33_09620, partial [Pirellulaceae bacterium]|nr:hypothetical protein [Pirellulaceae bacterium]
GNKRIANAARALLGLSMVSDVPQLEIESPLRELVQLIADESIWPEAAISQRDQFLAATRRWADIYRYKLIPEMFTYAESAVPAGDKEELESIFCDVSEVGRAIVSQFGILDPQGSALQKEKCVISAGPPPAGYEQLKAALITEDGLQQLCGLMEQWPAQRVKSERALHNAIKGEFFDALFKAIDNLDDAAKAAQIQEIFAETLKSELSAFLFSPTRIGDVDDGWWKPINRSETMSGKIKKVIKPGLRDNKGLLIAPAVVELD